MKKLSSVAFFMMLVFSSMSQTFRINGYGNYALGNNFHVYGTVFGSPGTPYNYYNGTIYGSFMWGAGVEYRIKDQFGAELIYLKQNTHATSTYGRFDTKGDINLTHQYFLVSGMYSFTKGQKLEPYAGIMLGAADLQAQEPKLQSDKHETKFAYGFRGGLNYWVSSRAGLKFQFQYLLVPNGAGGDLYYDSENNPENPAMYTSLSQFIVGGGITIRLGKTKN